MTARVTYTNGNVLNASDLTNGFKYLPYMQQSGITASGTSGTVTFTTAFDVAPIVIATVASAANTFTSVTISSVTTTGFSWNGWSGAVAATAGRTVHWTAIQMTSTTAAG
jgi:hypothetical protein